MRSLIASVALTLFFFAAPAATPAIALNGATADNADRFPFVVEIKSGDHLICSGTVLFPRIVITAAHCVQQKVYWRGGVSYVDDYLDPSTLSIASSAGGTIRYYDVVDVDASPVWRSLVDDPHSGERFAHDVALLVTKEPIDVGLPGNPLALPGGAGLRPKPRYHADDRPGDAEARAMAEGLQGLTDRAVLVAFGADSCLSYNRCGNAGVRRYQPVAIISGKECFASRYGRPEQLSLPPEIAADLPPVVWCTESVVLPGDSGGALLVQGADGDYHYLGVISAQRGISPIMALATSRQRSVATALYPSLDFILSRARQLGYLP
ncbi:trypsin-like serine protease [Methyloligella sp. 2.7D]|uniref:trypsin-like serine protease n=1 Tax=unclassified Methyloligella TaxID=2625955 RepID=UPI00157D6CA2|nr:trypsin-like serine protease [Methyloligella sp. GL2]QKP77976.1 trypsin-like serine protease [Methyloligella sp. GL2]